MNWIFIKCQVIPLENLSYIRIKNNKKIFPEAVHLISL